MSTDSTPSTTNSTAKRLYEFSNDELLGLLETRRRFKETPASYDEDVLTSKPWWTCELTNGVIYVHLTGGNEDLSEPSDLEIPLKDYKWFTVELWDHREVENDVAPSDVKWQMPGFPEFHIKIEYIVWPHIAIDPRYDERFKEQSWAKDFNQGYMGYNASVTPATLGEIVRFCDKISGLKAFW